MVNFGKKGWISVLFILITFALTDFISAGVFKPIFEHVNELGDTVTDAIPHESVELLLI